MNRRFMFAALMLIVLVVAIAVIFANVELGPGQNRIRVSASFYPMAEFVRQVGGDRVEVVTITPVGIEPHDYEPSSRDIVELRESQVFIYSGAGFEPWADKVLPDLKNAMVINASEGLQLIGTAEEFADEETPNQPAGGQIDPHFYLDPVMDQQVIQTIARKLSEADPANEEFYNKNASAYAGKLAALDREYREGLQSCSKRVIIASHSAFAYVAKRYGFRQVPIAGISEEEPSPAQLAQIAEFARANNIQYIFFESLVSPRLSETIAREIGAKTLVLNPIEGLTPAEEEAGKDFIGLMQENLANLRLALVCA